MSYRSGFESEVWFRAVAKTLRMVDVHQPSFGQIQNVLTRHLNIRVKKALKHMKDVEDPEEWLDLILKVDILLRLENMDGQSIRVGVDVTAQREDADYKLSMISSKPFRLARQELGIGKHWVVLVTPKSFPSQDRLVDALYEQVDRSSECAIVLL